MESAGNEPRVRVTAAPPPTLVVVHGEPGAGKSTLARALGSQLGLPVFDRDEFKDAIFDGLGWADRDWSLRVGAVSWEVLGLCIERLLSSAVSLIAESNFRPADPLVPRLRSVCEQMSVTPVEIYCTARADVLWQRFAERRAAGGRHPGHAGFEARDDFVRDLRARPHGPLGLGGQLVQLDTSDEWPPASEVAALVREAGRVSHRRI